MFEELIFKQVACPTRKSGGKEYFDSTVLSLIQFMYPTFKFVKTDFEIYPDDPFIYIGDIRWINKIKKRTEPHIIVSQTGEYDLSNMNTLIDLAYMKHNKKKPAYLEEMIKSWEPRNSNILFTDEFIYNWKHLWVTGTVIDKEIQQNKVFLDIIKEMNNPFKVTTLFLKASKTSDITYLERSLMRFIESSMESKDLSKSMGKSDWYIRNQQIFYASYSTNVKYAMEQLIHTVNNEDLTLRTLSLLMDVTLGDRV